MVSSQPASHVRSGRFEYNWTTMGFLFFWPTRTIEKGKGEGTLNPYHFGIRWPLCYNVSDNYKNFNLDLKGHTLYFSQLVVFSQQFALGWNVMWEAKLKCPLSTGNKIYPWPAQWEPQVNLSSNPTLTLTFFQLTVVRVKGGVSVQLLKYWHWCKSSCKVK